MSSLHDVPETGDCRGKDGVPKEFTPEVDSWVYG